jgi:hypothetical protein
MRLRISAVAGEYAEIALSAFALARADDNTPPLLAEMFGVVVIDDREMIARAAGEMLGGKFGCSIIVSPIGELDGAI